MTGPGPGAGGLLSDAGIDDALGEKSGVLTVAWAAISAVVCGCAAPTGLMPAAACASGAAAASGLRAALSLTMSPPS